MKIFLITFSLSLFSVIGTSQITKELFKPSDVEVSWLGIDFSHVKLIGEFSQFSSLGGGSAVQIRDQYFPSWNHLMLNEREKYDIKGMLRKGDINYDIDMLMSINSNAAIENMETYNTPHYTLDNIKSFITLYNTEDKEGIGILFIAESLNKSNIEAYFHFVAIDMKTKEILIHQRIRGLPRGFGLRNYWAGSIFNIIKDIEKVHYRNWKHKFK
tara:strand:+ start:3265 stop:3906 length:642 start_codon:yes stop_codon:yes gene_type:complete